MQRYPELRDIGFVALVPARQLPAFERKHRSRTAAVRSARLRRSRRKAYELIPHGARPYYCLAVDGLANDPSSLMPGDIDYCAFAPTLAVTRDFRAAELRAVQPRTADDARRARPLSTAAGAPVHARRARTPFVGWLGELLVPGAVLVASARGPPRDRRPVRLLQGHLSRRLLQRRPPAHGRAHDDRPAQRLDRVSYGPPIATGVLHEPAGAVADGRPGSCSAVLFATARARPRHRAHARA